MFPLNYRMFCCSSNKLNKKDIVYSSAIGWTTRENLRRYILEYKPKHKGFDRFGNDDWMHWAEANRHHNKKPGTVGRYEFDELLHSRTIK